jgi:flagellar motor component MotA
MNHEEFVEKYYAIVERALRFSEKARREGLLALEDEIDREKENERDIFEYGLRFVVDGYDAAIIGEILSNIINQEKDEQLRLLKTIQKEAVLSIQVGMNARGMYALLNSHTGLSLHEDKMKEKMEELYA